jgi:hypothetical protein
VQALEIPAMFKCVEETWIQWLNIQASCVLQEEQSSFAVCQWIEYQAFYFFDEVWKEQCDNYDSMITVVVSLASEQHDNTRKQRDRFATPSLSSNRAGPMKDSGEQDIQVWKLSDEELVAKYNFHGKNKNHQPKNCSLVEPTVRSFIASHWKKWVTIECPICFENISVSEAKEILPCHHYYCYKDISTYVKMIVPDLRGQRQNPFTCPLPSCRREMKLVQCVKTLLTEPEMDLVRNWFLNVTQPISTMLSMCPRTKKCGVRNKMRKLSINSPIVACDDCGFMWCELCLAKIPSTTTTKTNKRGKKNAHCHNEHKHDMTQCDASQVLDICHRYRQSKSREIKARCEEKWPWIRDYARARVEDIQAMLWIKENNCTLCPTCKTVIQRIEGCFHMKCIQCGTHFCYEW